MPRPKRPDPPVNLQVCIPRSLYDRMDKYLYSAVDERVPYGARTDLVSALLLQYLDIVAPLEEARDESQS